MKLPKLSTVMKGLLSLLAIAALCWSFWLGREVTMEKQAAVYQVLQNVSGIMFAVFGLWIGLLYPGLRKRVFERGSRRETKDLMSPEENDSQVADHLLLPFFLSLLILLLTLVVIVSHPLLRQLTALTAVKEMVRGVSFVVLTALAMAQIWTIFSAMHMTEALKGVVSKQNTMNKVALRIRQNAKNGEKDA